MSDPWVLSNYEPGTKTMSDIVERLRDAFKRKRYGAGEYDPDFDLFDAAADEIERLEKERLILRGDLGVVIERLTADNARLRAALREIADLRYSYVSGAYIAQMALEKKS